MNNTIIDITEDDLHAYVDQQLSVEKRAEVEALMLENADIAKQVQQWQQQNQAINTLFNKKSFADIPEKIDIKHQQISHQKPWFYSFASSIVLMIFSGVMGWYAHDLSTPLTLNTSNFVNSAISAHQVYTVEVAHPVEVDADNRKHLLAWLSKRIKHPLEAPDLQTYGYNLLGGRLLSMKKGRPAAQLMYEDQEGKRITLLVSKNPIYKDQAFHLKSNEDLNAYYWMDSTVAYSLTSELTPSELRPLSESVYQQLIEPQAKHIASL